MTKSNELLNKISESLTKDTEVSESKGTRSAKSISLHLVGEMRQISNEVSNRGANKDGSYSFDTVIDGQKFTITVKETK